MEYFAIYMNSERFLKSNEKFLHHFYITCKIPNSIYRTNYKKYTAMRIYFSQLLNIDFYTAHANKIDKNRKKHWKC